MYECIAAMYFVYYNIKRLGFARRFMLMTFTRQAKQEMR